MSTSDPSSIHFAAVGFAHGHIFSMCNALRGAGAKLIWIHDSDPGRLREIRDRFPDAKVAASEEEILQDRSVQLIACAAVPNERCEIALRAMDRGKDFLSDKPAVITLGDLERVKAKVRETGRKFYICFGETLNVESVVVAHQLIQNGAVGRVLNIISTGPHRLNAPSRPDWFFQKEKYGGILCDIGCHQTEQFLLLSGAEDAEIVHSRVANYHNKQHPGFEDFGDVMLKADNGVAGYFSVDWFTPSGLSTWGDSRVLILGTRGTLEIRKYLDVARGSGADHLFLVNGEKEEHIQTTGKTETPFFREFLSDCVDRTETAMTQNHVFKAVELCLKAQGRAVVIEE